MPQPLPDGKQYLTMYSTQYDDELLELYKGRDCVTLERLIGVLTKRKVKTELDYELLLLYLVLRHRRVCEKGRLRIKDVHLIKENMCQYYQTRRAYNRLKRRNEKKRREEENN